MPAQQTRNMRLAETSGNFIAAIDKPLGNRTEAFRMLHLFSASLRKLNGGGQVFVYEKDLFGYSSKPGKENFLEGMQEIAKIGGIAIDEEFVHANGASEK